MIYINIGPGMFLKLALCVWEDPGPFPYLEILREENQSEPKRLIDWLMFLDKQRIYPLGMQIYERIREEFWDSKT